MANRYPQSLPNNGFAPIGEQPLHDAYERCLLLQSAAGENMTSLMFARCLGHLIRELPQEAAEAVALEIISCDGDTEKLNSLSKLYIDHLIRLFRRGKGRTPAPSEHPSRQSFERDRSFYSQAVEPAPTDHKTAKKSALKRDNYRCMVTRLRDSDTVQSLKQEELPKYGLDQHPPFETVTNYCHIFPPSTNWGFDPNDPEEKKKNYAGTIWAIIERFRQIDILAELDGAKIHHLSNGLTMDVGLHSLFDGLSLWFEHLHDNTYKVHTMGSNLLALSCLPSDNIITFRSSDPRLSLPNPAYLKLHAAVCRVAHLSGASGYLELEDSRFERLRVLSFDGSSAALFIARLRDVALMA